MDNLFDLSGSLMVPLYKPWHPPTILLPQGWGSLRAPRDGLDWVRQYKASRATQLLEQTARMESQLYHLLAAEP